MNYNLLKEVIEMVQEFDNSQGQASGYQKDINGFKNWVAKSVGNDGSNKPEPEWEGKEKGRSPESLISTYLVHLNRYAKSYSRSAIHGSAFSTQEEFIYLINLKAFGEMTKMELIKKNIHEKPVGTQIINRLIIQGWVEQRDSEKDKRSKVIRITNEGIAALEEQMEKIREASLIVAGDLEYQEKMELIRLLSKLNKFHHPIYCKNFDAAQLLTEAAKARKQAVGT